VSVTQTHTHTPLSLSLSLGKKQTIDVAIQPSVGGEFNIQLKVPSAIADVKSAIAAAKGHSVGQQRLLFESEEPLEDTQLLQPLFANKQRRLLYLVLVPVDDVSVLLELNSTKQLDGRGYNKLRQGMTIEQVAELNLGCVTIRDGRVVELDLSSSGIRSLPEGVFDLTLKSLDIGNCKKLPLDVIDTICQKMPQLEVLALAGLKMTTLPKEIGSLQKLERLYLDSCSSLEAIPDEISKLQNLKDLNLGGTAITASPKIDGCSSLTDLNLKSCKKLTVDGLAEFCAHSPPTLQTLNLSYTNLESLPSEIGNLQSLTKLDCYGCESLQSK